MSSVSVPSPFPTARALRCDASCLVRIQPESSDSHDEENKHIRVPGFEAQWIHRHLGCRACRRARTEEEEEVAWAISVDL